MIDDFMDFPVISRSDIKPEAALIVYTLPGRLRVARASVASFYITARLQRGAAMRTQCLFDFFFLSVLEDLLDPEIHMSAFYDACFRCLLPLLACPQCAGCCG